jgi:SAM-dependent methyltransferase
VDSAAWDERYAAAGLVWSATPNRLVEAELTALPPGRALDLAAGEGRNALWLAGRGWRVTAVDFSEVALEKGRALEERQPRSEPVDWVHADALTWSGTGYDLALLAYLQLPEDQRRDAVRRAFTALEPGGTFFLVAHDTSNLAQGTGGPQDPEVLFTAEEVLGDLDGERFEVERAERVSRVVDTDDGHGAVAARTAYDALVRLVRTG